MAGPPTAQGRVAPPPPRGGQAQKQSIDLNIIIEGLGICQQTIAANESNPMNVQTMSTAINSLADRVRHQNISEDVLGLLSLLFAQLHAGNLEEADNTTNSLRREAGVTGKNWVTAIAFVVTSLQPGYD